MRCVAIVVSAVLLAACDRPVSRPSTPEAAYREFAEALRGHDPKVAWRLLSPATRSAAEERSKAIVAASQGVVRDDPMIMVLQSGVLPDPNIGDITVTTPGDAVTVLEVGAPTRRRPVTMVKDPATGSWGVDLSAAFALGLGNEAAK